MDKLDGTGECWAFSQSGAIISVCYEEIAQRLAPMYFDTIYFFAELVCGDMSVENEDVLAPAEMVNYE